MQAEGRGLLSEQEIESLGRTLEDFSGDSLEYSLRVVSCAALKARLKHLEFIVK